MPQLSRVSMERITIGFPPASMKPLGIASVYLPKRVPRPAAIITAVVIGAVDFIV